MSAVMFCVSFIMRVAEDFVSFVKRVAADIMSSVKHVFAGCVSWRGAATLTMFLAVSVTAFAQNAAGDYSAGTTALSEVAEEIAKYVPIVVQLCYAIAGVVAILGAISVYIAMNNEEQDVKKKIMMVVGACLFLIAAAQALPMFFGLG